MNNPGKLLIRLTAVLVLSLLITATAQAGSVKAADAQPEVTTVSAEPGALTPQDDWVSALVAGGTVILGPGEFRTDRTVELEHSVTVRGVGSDDTHLLFNSDGGLYGEQLVLLGSGPERQRFEFAGLSVSTENETVSDLMVAIGNLHLVLSGVSVCCSWDDLEAYYDPEDGAWWGIGLILGEGTTAYIERSEFNVNGTHGIAAFNADRVTVVDSLFSYNWWSGIYADNTNLTVTGSTFEFNDVGIEVVGEGNRVFARNTFEGQEYEDIYEW